LIKANFKLSKPKDIDDAKANKDEKTKDLKTEFEEFIVKSGAAGSFMIYRSEKKEDELGLEEL